MKSLTGQTTYATKQQLNPNNKSLQKSPTCLAIRALLCCVCISASLSGTYKLKDHTNIPTTKDNIPTATPTGDATQTTGKAGPNTLDVNKHESRSKAITPALDRNTPNHPDRNHVDTKGNATEDKEPTLPKCNKVSTNNIHTGKRIIKHNNVEGAGRERDPEVAHCDPLSPPPSEPNPSIPLFTPIKESS